MATEIINLQVDPQRVGDEPPEGSNFVATGILVRAQLDGKWDSHDICELDKQSLLLWLRSRGGDNPWAEDVVGILLGHGHLHHGDDR